MLMNGNSVLSTIVIPFGFSNKPYGTDFNPFNSRTNTFRRVFNSIS